MPSALDPMNYTRLTSKSNRYKLGRIKAWRYMRLSNTTPWSSSECVRDLYYGCVRYRSNTQIFWRANFTAIDTRFLWDCTSVRYAYGARKFPWWDCISQCKIFYEIIDRLHNSENRIVKSLSSLRVWITVLEITGILIVYTIESFLPSIVSLRDVMSSVKHSGNDSVCIELYESYEKIFLRSIEENYWNVREHSLPILWSTVHQ